MVGFRDDSRFLEVSVTNAYSRGDAWLGSATTVGSALRFRLMGLMWPRYSSARWVLWFDCLCAIKNILDYFMFCQ